MRRTSTAASSAGVDNGRPDSRERAEHGVGLLLAGHRGRGEVAPDIAVLGTREEQHVGPLGGPAGPAHLLVVGDRGRRCAEVNDEPEVRLVEPHAQGARRDQRLDPVVPQRSFEPQPVGRVGASGVGGDVVAGSPQRCRDVLGPGDGQRVDDPAAGQVAEVGHQPGQPLLGRRAAGLRGAASRGPAPRAAVSTSRPPRPQLLGDVGDHSRVGRRRRREHRRVGRQVASRSRMRR